MIEDIYSKVGIKYEPKNFDLSLDSSNNVVYADYRNVRLLTVFITYEIHAESVVPLNKLMTFSNSMSYSLTNVNECVNDCVHAIHLADDAITKLNSLVEDVDLGYDFIKFHSGYGVELDCGSTLEFGLSPKGFFCRVEPSPKGFNLTPMELDLALRICSDLDAELTVKKKVIEDVSKSEAFKIK